MEQFDDLLAAREQQRAQPQTPGILGSDPAPNDFDQMLAERQQERQRIRASAYQASQTPAAKLASQQQLANITGMPLGAVQTDEGQAKALALYRQMDQMSATSPVLRDRLANPDFAVLAQDDVGVLQQIENGLAWTAKYITSAPDAKQTLGRDLTSAYHQSARMAAGVSEFAFDAGASALDVLSLGQLEKATSIGGNPLRRIAEGFGMVGEQAGKDAKESGSQWDNTAASQIFGGGLSSGITSIAQNSTIAALAMIFAPEVAIPLTLGTMAAGQGGDSYRKAKEEGASQAKASILAMGDATAEYVGEKYLGMGGFLERVMAGSSAGKLMAYEVLKEVPGEVGTTLWQNFNEWAVLNPNKSMADFLAEQPAAIAQTVVATLVGGGGQIALSKAADTAIGNIYSEQRKQAEAQASADHLKQIMALAAQVKMREHSPQTFAEVTQGMAENTEGAPTEVRFDAKTLGEVLNQEELAQLPSIAAKIQEGVLPGDEISVPIGELMANVAGTPLEQKLLEHARIGDNELSQAEAKEAASQAESYLQSEAERVIKESVDSAAHQASADNVKQIMLDQFTKLNRWTADVNQAYATVAGNMYTALAGRLGVTPEQAYQRYPLKLDGTSVGEMTQNKEDLNGELQRKIDADFEGAVAEYSADKETNGGQVLNTDLARELSPGYRKDKSRAAEVHEAASAFIKRLYAAKLKQPVPEGKEPFVLFTAGGTGAGKSTALELLPTLSATASIVYDGTMSKLDSAEKVIQQALDAGRAVRYVYVFRDPADALANGALPRAVRSGRTAPVDVLHDSHIGARKVVEALVKKYANDPRVQFDFIDNSRGYGNAADVALAEIPQIDENGLKEKLYGIVKDQHRTGKISDAIARGFLDPDGKGTSQGTSGSPQRGNETARGGSQGESRHGLTLEGYHYSKQPRPVVSTAAFGTGLQGSNRDTYLNAEDQRLRKRAYFYVDKGTGINPEAGVGGIGHKAQLTNIYDGDADPLRLKKGGQLAFESAVLDHGFSGYLTRLDGTQSGQVILLGDQNVNTEMLGPTGKTTGQVVPPPAKRESLGRDVIVDALNANAALPGGHAPLWMWKNMLGKQPEVLQALTDAGLFAGDMNAKFYKSDLIKAFEAATEDPVYNQNMSSRLPSAVKATENPLENVLNITFDTVLSDEKTLAKNVAALQALPNFRKLTGKGAKDTVRNVEAFVEHVVNNLLWLHDHMPAEMRDRARLWYDGGRKTVEAWAQRYGISEMQGAAAIAVLSPQNGWFANVSQAERIADMVFGLRDFRWDEAMTAEAERISGEDGPDAKMLAAHGKTLGELLATPEIAARWARVYDQTHNNRAYRVLTPEGGAADYVKTAKGNDAIMMWKSYSTIAKAISVLTDGRAENVYYQIGKEHKVRNFYNNIFDPNSPLGYATIDTHAVAAALLRPLASADIEVAQAFGGGGSASSSMTGLNGTYPIYLEAYRRAAEARGIQPRQMQSITWEAVRGLFEAAQKSGMKAQANAIWARYKAGEIDQKQAQQDILVLANDITPPSWTAVPFTDAVTRTYEGPAQAAIDAKPLVNPAENGSAKVMFEVAPDPNDAKLTAEWNALSPEDRLALSQRVAAQIVPKVLKELGTDGDFVMQLGGYEGATNPSMTLRVDRPELAITAAKLLGHALSQDSMMVVTPTQVVGATPVGVVTIDLPDGWGNTEVTALYDKLWQLEHNGQKLIGGHTTADGRMAILNYSDLTTEELAKLVNLHLGDEFTVHTDVAFSAFPSKEEYGYASDQPPAGDATPSKSPVQQRPDSLRSEATQLLRAELDARRDNPAPGTAYAQSGVAAPNKYQAKYLAGRELGSLNQEQREQYDALADAVPQPYAQPAPKGPRATFSPKTLTISLLQGADLSSFHHEMAHFYLEVLADVASQPDAPESIKQDMQTLLNWFGVKDLATWNAMSLDEKRPHHEKFAETYEHYLFEGKSPSTEMNELFRRFASWMKSVYLSLKDFLAKHNTELTPEVRGVYDRMLATEQQIEQAEAARNYAPLFKSAEQAGMTPEAWALYQLQGQDATETAIEQMQERSLRDMRWTSNAKARALKAITKDVAEKRKAVENEVRAEVKAMPQYAAWDALKAKDGPKLETLALEELYGTGERGPNYDRYGKLDWKRLVDNKMTAKDGVHPDVLAEQFGFSSGDAMIRAMLDAEPEASVIEGMTDQRLLERYGDLATPAGIERAANEAVHNEARARFVATELQALSKANKPVNALVAAAKEFAKGLVAKRLVRDLKPGQHSAAETRAAKAAQKAMSKGDTQAAILAKRDQLLQFYAAKMTTEAVAEIEKKVKALRKIGESTSLPLEYQDQINKLLERVDLKARTLREIDKRAKLADWIKSQEEMGIEPEIPDYLREDSQLTSYKDMTVEEVRGLYDTVKQIEHLGRLKNKLLTAKDQREFQAVRDDIAGSILANAGDRRANVREPNTKLGRWFQGIRNFGSAHIKAATWARLFDGGKDGGKVWEYIVRPANEKAEWEAVRRAEASEKLTAILGPWLAKGKLSQKTEFKSIGRSLTRQEVLAMALNTGNDSNLQRLLGGEGWTVQQIMPVLQSLDKGDWQMVQKIWDHMESYWPEIAAKHERVYGVRLEKLPTGSAIAQQFGVKGGYYPVKYDPNASIRAEEHADAEKAQSQLKGAYNAATTKRSFTKARAEKVENRPLLYNLSGLYSGVNDVIHDLAWHEWLIDTNRLMRSTAIDTAIREHYGPAAGRQLKTWRDAIAEGDGASQEALDSALGYLRQSVSVAGLGFNVVSAVMQPLGLTQSISRVGAKWVGKGIAHYIANPVAATREAQEKSDFMANRARTQFRDLNELRNRVQGEDGPMNKVRKNAYFLMMQCQRMVDVPTWHGAYEKAISEGNDEERAIDLADQAVIDSQGGGETKDLSAIERGGPAQKLFTTFYSFMNTAANLGYLSARTGSPGKKAADVLMLAVVPAVLGAILKDAMTPGDSGDYDDWKKLMRKLLGEQLSYLLGLMVITREFGEAGKNMVGASDHPRDYAGPAGVRMISDSYQFAKQASQGEFDDQFRKAAVNLLGDVAGIPSAQVNRTITGAKALKEGKTSNPMALLMGYQERH